MRVLRSPSAEIAGLRGSYLAWLADHELPPYVEGQALWQDTVAVVDLAVDRAGLRDLHAWTPGQIAALHDAAGDEHGDALAALPLLLGFLAGTGRWSGTEAEFEAAVAAADELADPLSAVLDELLAVEVAEDAEDAALRGLPVIDQAAALVRFALPRRPVTGTGALRRADLVTAAQLVGVDLGGRRPRSMWDVPRLPDVWAGLVDVGLLDLTATAVVPAAVAYGWVMGDEAAGRVGRRMVLGGYLTAVLSEPPAASFLPDPLETLLPILAMAALGRPVPTGPLFATGDLDDPAEGGRPVLVGFAALATRALIESLAKEGILTVTDTVSVPAGLRRVVARTVAALLRAPDVDEPPQPELSAAGVAPAGSAWRIRVALEDARPPVWREALVDPGTPLDRLHEVIQRLFSWEGSHLHEFIAVAPGGRTTRFAPPDPDDDDWPAPGGRAKNEAGVRLGQVVGPRRGRLTYRYDFGDCWDHRITVVGPEAAGGPLPRCIAGTGAAPTEDSGGTGGWSEMVAAANDPRHPEHQGVREWLGLRARETLDPAAFHPADADERLADLRR